MAAVLPDIEDAHSRRQIDLFIESLVSAPLRDDRATMEFPFLPFRNGRCSRRYFIRMGTIDPHLPG
jgi:hypothetical protein